MSQIFLPLRSNAGWFTAYETRLLLERRLKNYMVLYDKIIIQDGRYICTVGESGSFESWLPANAGNLDRTSINYFKPGQKFGLLLSPSESETPQPVLEGEAKVSFEVDYYPILYDTGLLSADYFQWKNIDLAEEYKRIAQREARGDQRHEELKNLLPDNYFQQKNILDTLYIDSLLAFSLKMPFSLDYRVSEVIKWKNAQVKQKWRFAIEDIFYNIWISLDHPDFGDKTWEEVHNIRESQAGKDYRRMLQRITAAISEALPNLTNERELKDLVAKHFHKELVEALMSKLTTPKKAIVNIGINFIPYISIPISAGKDILNVIQERNSWISLLKRD